MKFPARNCDDRESGMPVLRPDVERDVLCAREVTGRSSRQMPGLGPLAKQQHRPDRWRPSERGHSCPSVSRSADTLVRFCCPECEHHSVPRPRSANGVRVFQPANGVRPVPESRGRPRRSKRRELSALQNRIVRPLNPWSECGDVPVEAVLAPSFEPVEPRGTAHSFRGEARSKLRRPCARAERPLSWLLRSGHRGIQSACPEPVERTAHAQARFLHHMRVDLRGFHAFMAEQLLNRSNVRAILE